MQSFLLFRLIVLLYTIALSVFHSQEMVNVVNKIVEQFLPTTARQGNQDFLTYWLKEAATVSSRHNLQAVSLLMILVSCTGIFLPLEVALNQAWGVAKSRNYLLNQVVAFGLAILMVFLAMGSVFAEHVAAAAFRIRVLPSHGQFCLRRNQLFVAERDDRAGFDPVLLFDLLASA